MYSKAFGWVMLLLHARLAWMCQGPNCGNENNGTVDNSLSCNWTVLKQELTISEPSIYTLQVEQTCPLMQYGIVHLAQCSDCAKMHQPCNDQFTACEGCCGTSWHGDDGNRYGVPSSHSCDELKAYYQVKNSLAVKCGSKNDTRVGSVSIAVEKREAFKSGTLTSRCSTPVDKFTCDATPTKLRFQCEACNIGSPDLLEQCCDRCMEFAEGQDVHDLRNHQGIVAFVWCSGCDTDIVNTPKGLPPFPFHQKSRYRNRTEAKADMNMSDWVEENVCAKLEHDCATTSLTSTTSTVSTTTPPVCDQVADCSGHGTTIDANKTNGCTCNCTGGFSGGDCSILPLCDAGEHCSGHGTTDDLDATNGCACTCSDDFRGDDCSIPPHCDSDVHCNGHSTLDSDSTDGCECHCVNGWSGDDCATPPGNPTTIECGGDYDFSLENAYDKWTPTLHAPIGMMVELSTCGAIPAWDTVIAKPCSNDDTCSGGLSKCSLTITSEQTEAEISGYSSNHGDSTLTVRCSLGGNPYTPPVTPTPTFSPPPPVTTTLAMTTTMIAPPTSTVMTTTIAATSTTTTTHCLDICELRELHGHDGGRLRRLNTAMRSTPDTSFCPWDPEGFFNLNAFYKPLEPSRSDEPWEPFPDEPVELDEPDEPLHLISSVTISGFTPSALRGSSTLSHVKAACAAGFAAALGVQPRYLVVEVKFSETTRTAAVSAFATEAVARQCDLRFPVEIQIEAYLKSPPFFPKTGYHEDSKVWANGTYAATAITPTKVRLNNTAEDFKEADDDTILHVVWSAGFVAAAVVGFSCFLALFLAVRRGRREDIKEEKKKPDAGGEIVTVKQDKALCKTGRTWKDKEAEDHKLPEETFVLEFDELPEEEFSAVQQKEKVGSEQEFAPI